MVDFCPTCMAVDALMRSRGFPAPVAKAVSRSKPIRSADNKVKAKVVRGSTSASRKLSKSLKTINKKARKKNGQLKKGYTQSRIMRDAHRMARK